MTNTEWKKFFEIGARILGHGAHLAHLSTTWCAWTIFPALKGASDLNYWYSGLPNIEDLAETHIKDSPSVWGQPFPYDQLAHIIIPRAFCWDVIIDKKYQSGVKQQNIDQLSDALKVEQIPHRKIDYLLEIKLF